jgi:surface polysaccharide O-acyltransferase-like enzyme
MGAPPSISSTRLESVDLARGVAIACALGAHSLTDFGFHHHAPPSWVTGAGLVTRSATPTFLVVFGMMIELVYRRRAERDGLSAASLRLTVRSVQCYMLYVLMIVAAWIGGKTSTAAVLPQALFLWNPHYGTIIRLYVILLILTIPLLALRLRFGTLPIVLLPVAVWAWHPWRNALEPVPDPFEILTASLVGTGDRIGPSVLHGMVLVCAGILIAMAVRTRQADRATARPSRLALALPAAAAILAVGILLHAITRIGAGAFAADLAGSPFRASNHPYYYAYGLLAALLVLGLAGAVRHLCGSRVPRWLRVAGQRTLFVYVLGNVLLLLLPRIEITRPWLGIGLALAFVAGLYALAVVYDRLDRTPMRDAGATARLLRRVQTGFDAVAERSAVWLHRLIWLLPSAFRPDGARPKTG